MGKKKTPLQIVNDDHGGKAKLVAALVKLVEPAKDESKDELKGRLAHVPNAKLLHLLAVGERAKELGGRDAIVKKIAELQGQPKDREFIDAVARRSLASLVDLHDATAHRAAGKAKKKVRRRTRKRRNRFS